MGGRQLSTLHNSASSAPGQLSSAPAVPCRQRSSVSDWPCTPHFQPRPPASLSPPPTPPFPPALPPLPPLALTLPLLQVLLLKGEEHLPQLKHRLALVMDHDRDIDIHRDASARAEYAAKVSAFYGFVQEWKRRERGAAAGIGCHGIAGRPVTRARSGG